MKILDKFKIWFTCKTQGKIAQYKEYKENVEKIISDINRYSKYLNDANQKFTNVKAIFAEGSKQYIDAQNEIYRWQYDLDERKLELKFVRPNSQQDIEYREKQCESFVDKLQSVYDSNLDLRFHGTPIYFAEQIIKSGTITPSAERYDGYIKSTDMKGEISASNIETLGRTINYFSDMTAYQRCLPSGCIFALFPKDKEDATYAHDLIHSVDFRKNPKQLFGVFTTPENIKQVKEWMNESGFNPNSVYTFEEFLQVVKMKSNSLNKIKVIDSEINDTGDIITNNEQTKDDNYKDEENLDEREF